MNISLPAILLLAVAPQHVRKDQRAKGGGFEGSGVTGDPTKATEAYGKKGIDFKVETAVARIQKLIAER